MLAMVLNMLRVRIFLSTAIYFGAIALALAQDRDLRTKTDQHGETIIGFCSRPSPDTFGFPGHAFVMFSEVATNGAVKFRSVGHTVAKKDLPATVFTYFGGRPVAGKRMEERYTHMKQACLSLKVDRNVYDGAISAARPTLALLGVSDDRAASAESYALNGNDCIDFVAKVAEALKAQTCPLSSGTIVV